ncbi:MAG TPA: hypothetical protein VGC66_07020 [Pyrinomonadaceae bacterium]|jgi:hypothetical protein
MRKQILKAATMFVGIIALAFVSALAASAQSPRNIIVNVPFEFSVKGKTLPAGSYIINSASTVDETGLSIMRRDGKANAVVLSRPVTTRKMQNETRLVFNRYGDRYFLSNIWISGSNGGRELFKTNQERSLEMELARNNVKPETVTLIVRAQ